MAFYKCGRIYTTSNSRVDIDTKSGSVARFNTSLAMPVLGCIAEFSASQAEGTPTPSAPIPIVGVDKVLITDCGKNLLSEIERDDTLINNIYFWKNSGIILPAGTYTWSTSEIVNFYLKDFANDSNIQVKYNTNFMTFTLSETKKVWFGVYKVGIDHNDKFQLEVGSTATDYEPYQGTTALINLGGTYYGGSVDAVTGKITKTWNYINLGKLEWFYNSTNGYFYNLTNIMPISGTKNWLCTTRYLKPDSVAWSAMEDGMAGFGGIQFRVKDSSTTSSAQFKQNINGTYLAYELETPETEYASNTAEIYTKAGLNNIFCDTGDIEVKYRKLHSDN